METRLTVGPEHAGERLDVFLPAAIEGLTRSQAKKKIEAGAVTVNGKPAAVHRFLKAGDIIELAAIERSEPVPDRQTPMADPQSPIAIIAESPSWIVAYKPVGMLMHPTSKEETNTFIDAMIAHAPEVARVGEDPAEPGIVSRLDRDVSGLVVIAKTQSAYEHLKRQFAGHTVEKNYLALVHGVIEQDSGDLRFRIARSASKARMAALPKESKEGRAAWTHYTVVKRLNGATLVNVDILTGRSHQIRAHLFAFNHPVFGDPIYQVRAGSKKRNVTAPRLMLESVSLGFNDPETNERKRFEINPDPAFEQLMNVLNG